MSRMFSGGKLRAVLCLVVYLAFGGTVASAQGEGWRGERRGDTGKDLNTVFFVDTKRGWAAGDGGVVVRTEDRGRTWLRQSIGTEDAINDIYFLDKEDGYLLAGNRIYVSSDAGQTWRQSAAFSSADFGGAEPELYSVRFTGKKRGWIVGSVSRRDTVVDSLVLKTEDGGTSWQRLRVPTKSELINLDFSGDKRGWIVGVGGVVLHTRDAGETWTLQSSGTNAALYNVDFRGDKKGWAVGERGTIVKTEDGGETWRAVTPPVRATFLGVKFVKDEDGWVVGRNGVILRTGDGGETWVVQDSQTKRNLYALFVDKDNCWAVGGDGLVLQYER